jgi:hypothetical protein
MTRYLIPAVVGGREAGPPRAAAVKSGPAPGEGVVPFHPLNINGPAAGKKACQV